MYTNILVPIALDHDRDVETALGVARALLSEGGTITALNVLDMLPSYASEYLPVDHFETQAKDIAQQLHTIVGDDTKVAVVHGHAGRTIVDYAGEHGMDMIVIASHQPGLQDYFLGSTAARVVRHAPCAVHVLR